MIYIDDFESGDVYFNFSFNQLTISFHWGMSG